jgi:hypothetical protein
MATPAVAQESSAPAQTPTPPAATPAPAPTEPSKQYTVTTGLDMPTAYFFRGIHQESSGVILQPPIDLAVTLTERVAINVGQWHSVHSGPTGNFYESDYYGSMTFTTGKLKPGLLFTSYTSPNDRFATVHELATFVSFDDSSTRLPLAPKVLVAFELDGQADGGLNRGTYLEMSVKPALKLMDRAMSPSIAVPVRLGLSLKDYYEGAGGSDTFGFASAGAIASLPIATGAVVWDFHGGVDLTWLGSNMTALNGGKGFKPIGIFGVTMTY